MPLKKIITEQSINRRMYESARQLRQAMTDAEKILWQSLRANRLRGFHFRRQQIIGKYIVDFYCHAANLVIEVDGEIHAQQVERDAVRDAELNADSTMGSRMVTRGHSYLLLSAAVMTSLLIILGGIVCVTASGQGCPDWPGCFGSIVPPLQSGAIIEYVHRLVAGLTSPLIIAAAIVGWRNARPIHWVSRPPVIAIGFLIAVIVFGAFAVLTGLPPGLAFLDLGSALIVLALLVAAAVIAFARRANPALPDRLSFRSPFAKLALWTMGAVFLVLASAVLVAESGSLARCFGWPLYNEPMALVDLRGWLLLARRVIAGVASILIFALVIQAWRTERSNPPILRAAISVGVLFLLEIIAGVMMLTGGPATFLLVIYVVTATALWARLVVLLVLTGLESSAPVEARLKPIQPTARIV